MKEQELQRIIDALEDLYNQVCDEVAHINRSAGLEYAMGEAIEIVKQYSKEDA
tara:strand:+ start:67 stop:225 length:159 start_codon:yes stop_codon:yes gene_type:complete